MPSPEPLGAGQKPDPDSLPVMVRPDSQLPDIGSAFGKKERDETDNLSLRERLSPYRPARRGS
jgi:hypothetical protein